MSRQINMAGKRYNSLTAIKFAKKNKHNGNSIWLFKCDCGEIVEIDGYKVRKGKTVDCKKCSSERTRQVSIKHGMSETVEFTTWLNIQSRCSNKKSKTYKYYGGRGIAVCDRWLGENGFINFFMTWD